MFLTQRKPLSACGVGANVGQPYLACRLPIARLHAVSSIAIMIHRRMLRVRNRLLVSGLPALCRARAADPGALAAGAGSHARVAIGTGSSAASI